MQKSSDGTRQSDVDLSDAKFEVSIGAMFGKIDIVDTDDFPARGVNDLLVEKIFLDREPGFIRLIGVQSTLTDAQVNAARGDFGNLVVAGNEWLKASTGNKKVGDAIGLLGRLDEEFADAANVVGLVVIRASAHEFGGVEQLAPPF